MNNFFLLNHNAQRVIMQYNVIALESRTELINAVQKSIDNGWTLLGGISIAVVNVNNIVFAQALTKE